MNICRSRRQHLRGADGVGGDAAALAEADAGVVLRRGVAEARSALEDDEGRLLRHRDAPPRDVAHAHLQQRLGVVELGGLAVARWVRNGVHREVRRWQREEESVRT